MKDLSDKQIVIWGVGVLQADIEAIYHLDNVVCYIDDLVEEKNLINVGREEIKNSEFISEMHYENVLFIICTKDKDYATRKLEMFGYKRSDYVLVEELLANKEIYDEFCGKDITIYGAGNTYLFWKKDLMDLSVRIERFAVTEKRNDNFDGKPVISLDELKELKGKTRIIVSSIYFREIYPLLIEAGFIPGYEFIQLDTFMAVFRLTRNIDTNYCFDNRSKGKSNLLVVLTGYKSLVWEDVFGRLIAFKPENTDICLVTSGKKDAYIRDLCDKNDWSYLSTEINNVSLVTNLAISLHPEADYIFKMDEDIFITERTFEVLLDTYKSVEANTDYEVGFVTPLIPINGYGYARILDILKLRDEWEKRFGEIKITDCYQHHMTIHDSPDAAEFLWGKDNPKMQSIDEIQKQLLNSNLSYSICPVRYSIGLILFRRDNWLRMGMFPVKDYENMGADEKAICKYCMMEGRVMVVAEKCIVGHLSYGPQHRIMENYYTKNREYFRVPKSYGGGE